MGIVLFLSAVALLSGQGPVDALTRQVSAYPGWFAAGLREVVGNRTNQFILTSAGASVLLLYRYDSQVQEYSQENGLLPDDLSRALDVYGGGLAYPLSMLGAGVASFLKEDSWEQGFMKTKYVWTSYVVTGVVTGVIKTVSHRQRPNRNGFRSFPSGHTSGSFVVAATMNELYGHTIGYPAFVAAALVGASRIHDNKHWLTDVIAGAAVGTVIGRGFGTAYEQEGDASHVLLVPAVSRRGVLLRVVVSLD